jgi:hypothetical protein
VAPPGQVPSTQVQTLATAGVAPEGKRPSELRLAAVTLGREFDRNRSIGIEKAPEAPFCQCPVFAFHRRPHSVSETVFTVGGEAAPLQPVAVIFESPLRVTVSATISRQPVLPAEGLPLNVIFDFGK